MENASKALIMVASIILGITLITFAIFVFGMFRNLNKNQTEEMESAKIASFNSEFFKYYESGTDNIKLTYHDIISIKNFVKENNLKFNLKQKEENSLYVTIDVYTKEEKIYGFEKKSEEYYTRIYEKQYKNF